LTEKPAKGHNKYHDFVDQSINFVPQKGMINQMSEIIWGKD